jgi:hypothetical protein
MLITADPKKQYDWERIYVQCCNIIYLAIQEFSNVYINKMCNNNIIEKSLNMT